MARKPDVPCIRCGKLTVTSRNSAPPERRVCHPCRREEPQRKSYGDPRTCALPGCSVIYTPTHKAQRFCSVPCANKSGRGITTGSRSARPCEICGRQLKAKGGGRTAGYVQRTCSRACGVELRYRNGSLARRQAHLSWTYIRRCRCGGYFATTNARQVFCSSQCRKERRCPCGTVLAFKRMLCDDCREEHQRQAKRQERRRRRALKHGVSTEPYTIAEIAARDRYRCGFCRKRVAMTKTVPHPKSPVIDHIIPLADGGDDMRANVQLAHFICNSLAGATGNKQAALFG